MCENIKQHYLCHLQRKVWEISADNIMSEEAYHNISINSKSHQLKFADEIYLVISTFPSRIHLFFRFFEGIDHIMATEIIKKILQKYLPEENKQTDNEVCLPLSFFLFLHYAFASNFISPEILTQIMDLSSFNHSFPKSAWPIATILWRDDDKQKMRESQQINSSEDFKKFKSYCNDLIFSNTFVTQIEQILFSDQLEQLQALYDQKPAIINEAITRSEFRIEKSLNYNNYPLHFAAFHRAKNCFNFLLQNVENRFIEDTKGHNFIYFLLCSDSLSFFEIKDIPNDPKYLFYSIKARHEVSFIYLFQKLVDTHAIDSFIMEIVQSAAKNKCLMPIYQIIQDSRYSLLMNTILSGLRNTFEDNNNFTSAIYDCFTDSDSKYPVFRRLFELVFKSDSVYSSESLIKEFSSLSNKMGFNAVRKTEAAGQRIIFLCNKHNKPSETKRSNGCGCPFRVVFSNSKKLNWHCTNHILLHGEHILENTLFQHKQISAEVKESINTLHHCQLSKKLISLVIANKHNVRLSSRQINDLIVDNRDNTVQSEELKEFIEKEGGLAIVFEDKESRKGILTFTKDEINNFENFGDTIFVDSTNIENANNWIVTPIAGINENLEIVCLGVFFSVHFNLTIAEEFLTTLFNLSFVKQILETVITDEDSSILEVFSACCINAGINVSHILCAWHKFNNFKKKINFIKDEIHKDQMLKCFKTICFSPYKDECNQSMASLTELSDEYHGLNEYINKQIIDRISMFASSQIEVCTLNYNTSSISESLNSMIKREIPNKCLCLTEIRQWITDTMNSARQVRIEKEYCTRMYLSNSIVKDVYGITAPRNVESLLVNSIYKSYRLVIIEKEGDKITFLDPLNQIKNTASEAQCDCGKLIKMKLPCSHIIRYWKELHDIDQNETIFPYELISSRWRCKIQQGKNKNIVVNTNIVINDKNEVPINDTYSTVTKLGRQLASIASRNEITKNFIVDEMNKLIQRTTETNNNGKHDAKVSQSKKRKFKRFKRSDEIHNHDKRINSTNNTS